MLEDILTPYVRELMKEKGCTMAEVVRSLRPGGPHDTFVYSTHCTQCGQKISGTLRQLFQQAGEGLCSCGGKLDATDLARWSAALRANDWVAASKIASIRQVEYEADGNE
jgi:hypothetical protein